MAFTKVASLDELWSGEMRACVVDGRRVVVIRLDDGAYAYEDRCAHLGVPLSDGCLEGHVLTCQAHQWEYDARSGHGINPASARLTPVTVRVEEGDILVDV